MPPHDPAAWLDVSDTAVFDAIVNEIERVNCVPSRSTLVLSRHAWKALTMLQVLGLGTAFRRLMTQENNAGIFAIVEDRV